MKIAAIDIGLKRVGVAFCFDNVTVLPQNAIIRKGRNQAAKDVNSLLLEWEIEKLIIGIPKGGSSEEEMSRRIKHFTSLLNIDGVDIEYIDESFTSYEAKEQLKGVAKQKRDGRVDSMAAKIILERWLSKYKFK